MEKSDSLYMMIYNYIKDNIAKGDYANGERLPTEMELAKQFYVSRITPKRALDNLASEGIIIRIPGKGSFLKDYVQNTNSMAIKRQQKSIAIVMGGYDSSFGFDILKGAIDTCEELSLNLIVKASHNSQEKEAEIVSSLMDSGVAGIIVQPSHGELYSETLLKAVYSGYPIVMLDRMMQGINAPFVGVDNASLSQFATGKLLKKNHQNVALIALEGDKTSSLNERMNGFSNAHIDKGLPVNKELFLTELNSQLASAGMTIDSEGAYEFYVSRIAEFLREHEEVTAIFGTEYKASKAAYDAVRRVGKRVPQDISLVSFDMDTSYIGTHRMSHIKQPQGEMGRIACLQVSKLINRQPIDDLRSILAGEWVDGASIQRI